MEGFGGLCHLRGAVMPSQGCCYAISGVLVCHLRGAGVLRTSEAHLRSQRILAAHVLCTMVAAMIIYVGGVYAMHAMSSVRWLQPRLELACSQGPIHKPWSRSYAGVCMPLKWGMPGPRHNALAL